MLEDLDLERLNNHLDTVAQEHGTYQKAFQALCKQVEILLSDYKSLKSDYEEVKEGRDKYKKQARGQVQYRA